MPAMNSALNASQLLNENVENLWNSFLNEKANKEPMLNIPY